MKPSEEVRAFAPAHISCIFRTYHAEQYEQQGSLGFGFTLNQGAAVTVKRSEHTVIVVNKREMPFEAVREVLDSLTELPVEVTISTDVPFGSGFGMSGASALAAAYALNRLLQLNREPEELALIAHVSEVKHGTGLGDVCGQYHGGILIRTQKGQPLRAQKKRSRQRDIYYKVYGEIETRAIITNTEKKEKIDRAGDHALEKIRHLKKASFQQLVEISKAFACESGLLTHKQVMRDIELVERQGGKASMIMLGEAVFSTIPLPGYHQAAISTQGAKVL